MATRSDSDTPGAAGAAGGSPAKFAPNRPLIIGEILQQANGNRVALAAAVQVFALANPKRTHVQIRNCSAAGTLYVGYDNTVSPTNHIYAIAGGSDPVTLAVSPHVPIWIIPDGVHAIDYAAAETRQH